MEFLQDAFREGDSFDSTRTTDTITLDITYDDPELHALLSVVSTDWASETLKESLKQGRLTNDLWALGLPLPDDVTNVCIVEDKYLRVRVVVICDQLVDLSSPLNPTNKYWEQLRIRNITIVESTPKPIPDSLGIDTLTTLFDYYRRVHLQEDHPHSKSAVTPIAILGKNETAQSEPPAADQTGGSNATMISHSKLEEMEKKIFAAGLNLALQTRRLADVRCELQDCQAQKEKLASKLKEQEVRCELRARSAQVSELHGRMMEFRVSMSERRQRETESHAVQLLDALLGERRMRLQAENEKLNAETELAVERERRYGAEAMVEAISSEARWPFVMPNMLDIFLKLEGMVEEVRDGKEK